MGIYEAGKYIEVHPTFLYESISTLTIFIILTVVSKNRKFKGQITYLYLIMYSFARAIIEGLRTDSLMLGPIRISQALSIIIFIMTVIAYIKRVKSDKLEFVWGGILSFFFISWQNEKQNILKSKQMLKNREIWHTKFIQKTAFLLFFYWPKCKNMVFY